MNASLFAISSRRLIAAGAILALAACGGGGGSSPLPGGGGGSIPTAPPAPTPTPTPGSAPAGYGTPVFHITIPRDAGSSQGTKTPSFVSTGTQSVKVQLTADSQGIDPSTVAGNPAITDISGASCSSGCTVNGPLSPVGSNTYTFTTYDATGAGGNALDTASGTFVISQGVANNETITLLGIPASISFPDGMPPGMSAGGPWTTFLGPAGNRVVAKDAAGQVITGVYATPITISVPDTNGDGLHVSSDPCLSIPPTGNPTISPSSVDLTYSGDNEFFCYGGLAENPVTLSADSGSAHATAIFTPILNAPAYLAGSGTPSGIVSGNPPDIALFTTSGAGSTGAVTYTESGWTNSPYNQKLNFATDLACSAGGPFFLYGSLASAYDATGTIFTLTLIASPSVGACPVEVSDGMNLNINHSTAQFGTSYTTSSFGVNGTKKRQ